MPEPAAPFRQGLGIARHDTHHSPARSWGGAPLRALTPERAAHGTTTRARRLAPRGRAPTAPSAREVPHAPTTLTHEGIGQLQPTDSTRLLQPHLL